MRATASQCSARSGSIVTSGGKSDSLAPFSECVHQRLALLRAQILHSLAHGHTRRPVGAERQPFEHFVRPNLACLPQHPADRLSNEEFLLVDHGVGITAEALE